MKQKKMLAQQNSRARWRHKAIFKKRRFKFKVEIVKNCTLMIFRQIPRIRDSGWVGRMDRTDTATSAQHGAVPKPPAAGDRTNKQHTHTHTLRRHHTVVSAGTPSQQAHRLSRTMRVLGMGFVWFTATNCVHCLSTCPYIYHTTNSSEG